MKTISFVTLISFLSFTCLANANSALLKLKQFDQELSKYIDKPGKKESLKVVGQAQDYLESQHKVFSTTNDKETLTLLTSVCEKICRVDPSGYIAELLTEDAIRNNKAFMTQVQSQADSCLSKAFADYETEQREGNDRDPKN